jgi:hypothetical protein
LRLIFREFYKPKTPIDLNKPKQQGTSKPLETVK